MKCKSMLARLKTFANNHIKGAFGRNSSIPLEYDGKFDKIKTTRRSREKNESN